MGTFERREPLTVDFHGGVEVAVAPVVSVSHYNLVLAGFPPPAGAESALILVLCYSWIDCIEH